MPARRTQPMLSIGLHSGTCGTASSRVKNGFVEDAPHQMLSIGLPPLAGSTLGFQMFGKWGIAWPPAINCRRHPAEHPVLHAGCSAVCGRKRPAVPWLGSRKWRTSRSRSFLTSRGGGAPGRTQNQLGPVRTSVLPGHQLPELLKPAA
jgi:hypothetical protein